MKITKKIPSSFRDPSGFLYRNEGRLLRQVNHIYSTDYNKCVESGLFSKLMTSGELIPHIEVEDPSNEDAHCILQPEELAYISYPYEWSFSQLKEAALLTLKIHQTALQHDLGLKDASAFNVQFRQGKPIFIDTLSFESYEDGTPWIAYRQFCQHFLAPLALMAYRDLRLGSSTALYIDGIPLDLASKLLPHRSWFKYSLFAHIHMHSKSQQKHQDDAAETSTTVKKQQISKAMHEALIASLVSAINGLRSKDVPTEWGSYYENTNYSEASMSEKEQLMSDLAEKFLKGESVVHDLGANTGRFSQVIGKHVKNVISHDIDEIAVERNYQTVAANGISNMLPLRLNLVNPTPAVGWDLIERESFHSRVKGDSAIALALIHHLCISNNVPLQNLADFFSNLFKTLIIEFVPKEDSQVKRLLATREDIFDDYTIEGFERAFTNQFEILERCPIEGSVRTIFVLRNRNLFEDN